MMIALCFKRLFHKRTDVDKYYSYTTRFITFTDKEDSIRKRREDILDTIRNSEAFHLYYTLHVFKRIALYGVCVATYF